MVASARRPGVGHRDRHRWTTPATAIAAPNNAAQFEDEVASSAVATAAADWAGTGPRWRRHDHRYRGGDQPALTASSTPSAARGAGEGVHRHHDDDQNGWGEQPGDHGTHSRVVGTSQGRKGRPSGDRRGRTTRSTPRRSADTGHDGLRDEGQRVADDEYQGGGQHRQSTGGPQPRQQPTMAPSAA